MIIAISGKFCSGKDSVADFLAARLFFQKVEISRKLKEVCRDVFGMQGKDRTLLQLVGEKAREIEEDVWLRHALIRRGGRPRVVIPDVRYRNEFYKLKGLGAIMVRLVCAEDIRIRRYRKLYGEKPSPGQLVHPSETDLDDFVFDLSFNTGGISKEDRNANLLVGLTHLLMSNK